MRLYHSLISLAVLLLLTACWEKKSDGDEGENGADSLSSPATTELDLYEERQIPTSADANFEDFFYAFTTDDDFAESRMDSSLVNVEDGKEAAVDVKNWNERHLFKYQELYAFIYTDEEDAQLIKSDSLNNVAVEFVKLETMKADRYEFCDSVGKWMMTRIIRQKDVDAPYTDFLDFYNQFVEDRDFQLESLATPVNLIYGSESEMDEGGTFELNKDDWSEFHSLTPMPENTIVLMDYGQNVNSGTSIHVMIRSIAEAVSATYHFRKVRGNWKLFSIEQF